ncbi:protein CLT1, chloroplastic-like [Malus sylvestris]|uniref:protein CLT1, chloroplastic-like n=1 Tax=Malus domestica TaxID=3750 RepID=UPI0021AC81F8|nr:protein CLT1, chloroplastic-like [Malus sylvestris]
MISSIHRVWAGAGAPEPPIWIREPPRLQPEISHLRHRYYGSILRQGIRLRTTPSEHLRRVTWTVEAVGSRGAWERSEGGEGAESLKAGPCSYAVGEYRASVELERSSKDRRVDVAVAAAVTVVLGVGNRVLYKLALVPLKHYPFFLAQLATFGYVIVYFSVLYLRYRAGIVTDEMLSMPKAPFLAVGLLEALGAATGMAAGAILSGASIPVLSQTFLVWQILLSIIFLGRRYRVNQLLGCVLVAIGVIITVASGSSAGYSLKEAGVFWSLLMIVSFLFQAADTVLKEVIFLDARQRLKGRSVDLFVVNSFGSAFQALFICLLLPFLSKLWGIPFGQLPNYLKDGAACFLNMGTLSTGCDGAPLLPLLFVIVNMGFNISLLHLLKISSAVVSSLASTFSVPISVYVFTLPLPHLGVAASLPTGFVSGTIVLVIGLLIYAWTPSVYPTNASPSPPTV